MRDMVSYFIDVFTGPLLANQVHGDLRIQPFQYFFLNSSNTGQTTVWSQRRIDFVTILNFIIHGILDARAWENILTGNIFPTGTKEVQSL
jgi:hypothetical protein